MPSMMKLAPLVLLLPAASAFGHGSMGYPISRTYNGFQEGPESPQSAAVGDAVDCGGTQPLYDWHEVVNFFPGSPDFQRDVPYEEEIPDGRLASGNNPKYFCFDEVRSDWPATDMASGQTELVWYASTIHNPSVFRVWITTPDWNPETELNWDQMEELAVGEIALVGQEYRLPVTLPEREGRHVIYCIWQRLDPVGEGFYSASDVIFGPDSGDDEGGTDDGQGEDEDAGGGTDDDGNDDGTNEGSSDQGPDSASITLLDQWDGSWQGQVTVTNSTGDLSMLNWELAWEGGPDFASIWNATLSTEGGRSVIRNEAWNGFLAAGQSTTFGFIANGTWPPTVSNVTLNGLAIDLEGIENEDAEDDGGTNPTPCPGDVTLDGTVDVSDILELLANWGSTDPENPADVDGDGVVAVGDALIMLESWGECP